MNTPQIDSTRLLIKSPFNSDEFIRLYIQLLLNPNLNEKFKIFELKRRNEYAQVKLNQPIRSSLDDLVKRAKLIPILADVQLSQVREPDTIRVSQLSNQCSKELLMLYFSNEKLGGGDVKTIKYFNFENKALVQFVDFKLVDRLITRKHVICGKEVLIEKYYDLIESEYDDVELDVKSSGLSSNDALDRTKLIISDISETTPIQQIDYLIRLVTDRQEISKIDWSFSFKNRILISFRKEINLEKTFELYKRQFNNLNGKKISLETVNKTNKLIILVKKSDQKLSLNSEDNDKYSPETIPVTKDLLELYFTNKLRSGSNGYTSIERISSHYWMIEITNTESIESILSREHMLDCKPFYLFPYYSNFGLPYLSTPHHFKLKLRTPKLKHLCECSDLLDKLNNLLSETNCKINKFNTTQQVIYLEYASKVSSLLPYTENLWRLKCKQTLDFFLKHYKYDVLNLTTNQWRLINRKLTTIMNIEKRAKKSEFVKLNNELYARIQDQDEELVKSVQIVLWGSTEQVDETCSQIRDLVCRVYFSLSNEQKLMRLVTHVNECENLLVDWKSNELFVEDEIARESRMHTMHEMICKSENGHIDLELEYNSLFEQEEERNETKYEDVEEVNADEMSEFHRIRAKLNDLKLRINLMKQLYYEFTTKK